MLTTPEIQIIETNFVEKFQQIQNKFNYYDGYRNNCSRVVKKFLASFGAYSAPITPWADTVTKVGPIYYNYRFLKEGDIIAMGRPGDTHHVGVYLGDSKVLHQSAVRGYKVGAFDDLSAFINSRHGFYFVRPSYDTRQILEQQYYIAPELA
jgi:cell wall-associated NlpC family hydrolase